jgi:hypothetical protein
MGVQSDSTAAIHRLYESLSHLGWKCCTIEFGVPMKQVKLIKMCLNEICSNVLKDKYLSDMFPFQNGLHKGML